jgi:NMT1-like family
VQFQEFGVFIVDICADGAKDIGRVAKTWDLSWVRTPRPAAIGQFLDIAEFKSVGEVTFSSEPIPYSGNGRRRLLSEISDKVTGWNAVQFKSNHALRGQRLTDSSEFFRVSLYRRHESTPGNIIVIRCRKQEEGQQLIRLIGSVERYRSGASGSGSKSTDLYFRQRTRQTFLMVAQLRTRLVAISWRDLAMTLGPILLLSIAGIWFAVRFVRPAPPDTVIMTSGPDGSMFRMIAEKYRSILARNRVTLKILPSNGSLENLQRLSDRSSAVDLGFIQGGVSAGVQAERLMSLGSVFYEPLAIFYRSDKPLNRLSQLTGKRLAIGGEGSGVRVLALTLLEANGIKVGGHTPLLDLSGEDAARALRERRIDAVFLMGDSATPTLMRQLVRMPGIRFFDFVQAEAYTRRFRYLTRLELPMGALDLGKNSPAQDLFLIAPTVELVARDNLHPAISDLLIEAAREVHGGANLLQHAGEFPAPLEHEFRISDDAVRYYKSGKSFLYRLLPFWLASLTDRAVVILVPVVVLLLPGLRLVPWLYQWRVKARIYRWYGALIGLERAGFSSSTPDRREEMLKRLDDIERGVNNMKMPLAFADQFYVLREHIRFVRDQLSSERPGT